VHYFSLEMYQKLLSGQPDRSTIFDDTFAGWNDLFFVTCTTSKNAFVFNSVKHCLF